MRKNFGQLVGFFFLKQKNISVDGCVNVFILQFDRGRGDLFNIIGVVINLKERTYEFITKAGLIESQRHRKPFKKLNLKYH